MKVLYVITGLGMGGAERQILDLARYFAKDNDVLICYLTGQPSSLVDASTLPIRGLGINKGLLGAWHAYFRLRKAIQEFRPDVIHSHMVHANILSRLVRLTIAIPRLVCTAHNTYEGGKLRMFGYRVTHFLADVTTNVSAEAVLAFEKNGAVPPGGMITVPNGIDTDVFKFDSDVRKAGREEEGLRDTDKIILAIGRLVVAKDFSTLLYAFEKICQAQPDTQLWIVGEGPERSRLESLARSLGVAGRTRFLGLRSDVARLYNLADVYVLSSAWEGFGLVVAEAMATGKVVVATDSGGVREVIGGRGNLVPVGDWRRLSESIIGVLELSEFERFELGLKARNRIVEHFSLARACATWTAIYSCTFIGSDGQH